MLKVKYEKEPQHVCGECENFVESPFNEGYGICVLEDCEGHVSAIEFTDDTTKCFTGKYERVI